jgi:hypothetical protein
MKFYYLKISLRGISPMVWRRLRIPGAASLAMLHDCIQVINDWDNFNLHQFHIYGKDYGINYDGGLYYSDNAHTVYLDDFNFDTGDKFTYEYNFFEQIVHDIRIENITESLLLDNKIICLSGSGMPGATKYDVMKLKDDFLKLIVARKGRLTIADIRKIKHAYNRVKFNKSHVNSSLASIVNK